MAEMGVTEVRFVEAGPLEEAIFEVSPGHPSIAEIGPV
jgi:hypothetical protein